MWWHILPHALLSVFEAAVPSQYKPKTTVNKKWALVWGVFALMGLIATAVVSYRSDHTDILLGKAAVEGYMKANFTAFLMMLMCVVVFVILLYIDLKNGVRSIMMFVAGFTAVAFMTMFIMSSHRIQNDLDHPRSVNVREYALCRQGSRYYVGFEDKGEFPLLAVPEGIYRLLKNGEVYEGDRTDSEIWMLVKYPDYTEYEDPELYSTPTEITYYFNSAIFLGAKVE